MTDESKGEKGVSRMRWTLMPLPFSLFPFSPFLFHFSSHSLFIPFLLTSTFSLFPLPSLLPPFPFFLCLSLFSFAPLFTSFLYLFLPPLSSPLPFPPFLPSPLPSPFPFPPCPFPSLSLLSPSLRPFPLPFPLHHSTMPCHPSRTP